MNFSVNIYDTLDPNANTIFEYAEANSLILKWNGSDNKLESILGSDFSFTMEVTNYQDAYFKHLYTYDERRYPVELIDEDKSLIIWKGHLLPDQYDEPYTNGAFFVNFMATCGLGGLKGQYLPDEYYREEKLMSDVLSQCIKLTGLELDIYVTPALTNKISPRWDQNYIDTTKWLDNDKKDDAYKVLDSLMNDALCSIRQCDGGWYVYGHNKRNVFTATYSRYDINGVFKGDVTETKSVRNVVYLYEPRVRTNVPRSRVSATYDVEASRILEGAYKVKNDGYTLLNNDLDVINHEWAYTDVSFTAKYNTRDGKVFFAPFSSTFQSGQNIVLRKELLVLQGIKMQWEVQLTSAYSGTEQYLQSVEDLVLNGDWDKLIAYDIFYTDPADNQEVILFSNQNGPDAGDLRYQLSFDVDRKASLIVEMIAPATAYYNIRFYRPFGTTTTIKTDKIFLDMVQAKVLDVDDQVTYTNEIKQVYTQVADVELTLHDDMRYYQDLIRLTKLGAVGAVYDTQTINNIQVIEQDSKHYIQLTFSQLKTAIAHPDNITVDGDPIVIVATIYNNLGSDEFLLQYDDVALGRIIENNETMVISLRRFASLPSDITDWTKWTDDVYQVSYKRYGEIITDILRNLYTKSHPLIYATCRELISPRSMLNFNYEGDKVFYPLDMTWKLDQNESDMILSQNFYGEAVTANLPPSVDAGADISIAAGVTIASLLATANDPDGSIVSVLWEWINTGGAAPTIVTPDQLDTDLTGLTQDVYEFRVTVTDDVGLTASDTVRISRIVTYSLVLTEVQDTNETYLYTEETTKIYDMSISPALDQNQTARFTVDAILVRETPIDIAGARPTVVFAIGKNVVFIGFNTQIQVAAYFEAGTYRVVFLQRRNESHRIRLYAKAFNTQGPVYPNIENKVHARIQADINVEIITGQSGAVSNVPVQLIVDARQ